MEKPHDFVYILGRGSKWGNNELRYSLRSLENVPHGRVFIVGYLPPWVQNVTHIKAHDIGSNKIINAQHKLRLACEHAEVSKEFVLMNDDFFFLKPTKELVPTYCGTLEAYIKRHPTGCGYYLTAMQRTDQWLRDHGFKRPLNFETHMPLVRDKEKVLFVLSLFAKEADPFFFRSIYCALFAQNARNVRKDCKLYRMKSFASKARAQVLSTNDDSVLSRKFQEWIARKFPTPCQYEDPDKPGEPYHRDQRFYSLT